METGDRSVTEGPPVLPLAQQQPGPVDRQAGELHRLGRLLHLDSDGIDSGSLQNKPSVMIFADKFKCSFSIKEKAFSWYCDGKSP